MEPVRSNRAGAPVAAAGDLADGALRLPAEALAAAQGVLEVPLLVLLEQLVQQAEKLNLQRGDLFLY